MRILQLCNRIPYPPKDGGAIAMLNMTRGFLQAGVSLKTLALNTNKHYVDITSLPEDLQKKARLEAVFINTDVKAGAAVRNLLFSRESYNIIRFYSRDFEQKLIEVLQKEEFDIIQLEGLHISIYLDTIRKYSKALVSLRAHNVEHLIWQRLAEAEKSGLKKKYLSILASRMKTFELSVLNKFDFLIPITGEDAETFKSLGCRIPMQVSPSGLDVAQYKTDRNHIEKNSFFHLGALDWLPNQQAMQWFLEKIWPVVYSRHPEAHFYIAGRNLPQWLKDLRLPGVRVEGEVASAAAFINSKEIMVVPLLSGSGMRIKIIEGMALGKAIISTGIGAEGIHYTNGENILIADSEEEFISAMEKCLSEYKLASQLGRNARTLAEKEYDNSRLIKELLGFYSGQLKSVKTLSK